MLQPGVGLELGMLIFRQQPKFHPTRTVFLSKFCRTYYTKSIVEAMATNEILQIAIFSIFLISSSIYRRNAKPVVNVLDRLHI
jgi:Na+/H+-dicarboxylate symporter